MCKISDANKDADKKVLKNFPNIVTDIKYVNINKEWKLVVAMLD